MLEEDNVGEHLKETRMEMIRLGSINAEYFRFKSLREKQEQIDAS